MADQLLVPLVAFGRAVPAQVVVSAMDANDGLARRFVKAVGRELSRLCVACAAPHFRWLLRNLRRVSESRGRTTRRR